jgi:uncharacterized lipoprotein YajG
MRVLIGVVAVVLLSGCASPSDLKQNAPSISANTSKDPKQYALCVFPKWQDARSTSTMSETQNGYRLIAANDMMTDEVLEISKSTLGSKVSLYQRMPWAKMVGRGAIEDAVQDCI